MPVTQRTLDERRQQLERVLALGRLTLALLVATVLRLDGVPRVPTEPIAWFVIGYTGYALAAAVAVAVAGTLVGRLGVVLHWIDVAWVLPITALTEGPGNVFLVFFVFVLVGAAYRWGLRQTVATGLITATALFAEAAALQMGMAAPPGTGLASLVARSAHAVGLGLLIGYLAEEQHITRNQLIAASRVLAAVNAKSGLRKSIGATLRELLRVFQARSAVLSVASKELAAVHRWELPSEDGELSVTEEHASSGGWRSAGRELDGRVWRLRRRPDRIEIQGTRGVRTLRADSSLTAALPGDADSALVGDVVVADGWAGRLVLVDPAWQTGARGRQWLARLLPHVGLALYSVYLLGRLRSRATAMERARLARELHDGVIQSLVGLEMHVDVLRRRLQSIDRDASGELEAIQTHLRGEVVNVRELMNEVRPVSADAQDVPAVIASIAERFRRDSGIDTRFVCTLTSVPLAAPRVRELVRITQESLVNVRKHSGAHNVILRLGMADDACVLTVDDDGCGFGFEGRYALDELDATRRGPLVIKERVRHLGGTMVLDSRPGRGSRLEIVIPRGDE